MRLAAAALAASLAAAGCASPRVVRVVGGEPIEGRFIPPRAYALYAIGADAEAHGDAETALAAYTEAEGDDPQSADIWTRIGALRCRLEGRRGDPAEAFDRAVSIDPTFEPAWRERARCAAADGRLGEALAHADRAVQLDPDRDEAILLHAALLERLRRPGDARRELRALTIRHPTSVEAWRALAELELRAGDRFAAAVAARRLRALAPRHADELERRFAALHPLAEVDEALSRGDLDQARRAARRAGLAPAEIAVHAAALGRAREAIEQAELVLGADPSSTSALIALAVAAELAGDTAVRDRAWSAVPGPGDPAVPPSPLARLLLCTLLIRLGEPEAALAWLGKLPDFWEYEDLLARRLARRLRFRLKFELSQVRQNGR